MRIAELFYSIQGEGKLAGVPSLFVRASGCNLRCTWCDTPYASWEPQGRHMSADQILARLIELLPGHSKIDHRRSRVHTVITGGEPMIMPDIGQLCAALKQAGHHITIETAATVYEPLPLDLASLSPKLASSTPWDRAGGRFAAAHERLRLNVPVIQRFIDESPDFQLKFVIASRSDVDEIHAILDQLRSFAPADVLLMPEGTDAATLTARAPWIAEICRQSGFRYCPRLHVELYGNTRGT